MFTTPYHSVNDCLEIRPPILPVSSCTVLDTSSRIAAHHLWLVKNLPFSEPVVFFGGIFHFGPIDLICTLLRPVNFLAPRTSSPGVHRIWAKSSWKAADNHLQQKRCANGKCFLHNFGCRNHGMRRAKIWSIYECFGMDPTH